MRLDWHATMSFFSAHHLILNCVAHNCAFLWPNRKLQHHVIAWLQSCSGLKIDLASADWENVSESLLV